MTFFKELLDGEDAIRRLEGESMSEAHAPAPGEGPGVTHRGAQPSCVALSHRRFQIFLCLESCAKTRRCSIMWR